MSVFLGQLPPAELARLKAELAETLIAYFCYPRFFDYRTESLRSRPVDRTKRQEVWLYLSSVDFTAWNRIDLMSPDFQHQIERLLIHFVQRNRSFFGEQGRKRMSDIRMLISSSAAAVTQGLRSRILGQEQRIPPFGSPRPVVSWSTPSITNRSEPGWEQITQATMLLQQQVQEMRGEIKPAAQSATRQPLATPQQTPRNQNPSIAPTPVVASSIDQKIASTPLIPASPVPQSNGHSTPSLPGQGISQAPSLPHIPSSAPVAPAWNTVSISSPGHKVDGNVGNAGNVHPFVDTPTVSTPLISALPTGPVDKISSPQPQPSATVQPHTVPMLTPSAVPVPWEKTGLLQVEEDVAIFEEMRKQLIVWLRIQAVRSGMDISGQGALQLIEQLRQQENCDETRLQVVSTLLNLTNSVLKNGQASPFDYKQALMFHLMHTRR